MIRLNQTLRRSVSFLVTIGVLLLVSCTYGVADERLERVTLPPGFAITVYAKVPGARTLAVLPSGRAVIVGTRGGRVYAAMDLDGDHRAETVRVLYDALNDPNGVATHQGWLYVAERHRISRVRLDDKALNDPPPLQPIYDRLPNKRWHGSRVLAFGPDGRLYAALGSPCNVCMPDPPEDSIVSMAPDGSNFRIFASGIRNSVGLSFHPASGELFFTDNGADGMGDDSPPDELNRAPRPGMHFGFPWYGGGQDRTPQFLDQAPPVSTVFPVINFQAHTASLGLHFYRGRQFPAEYRNDAFVAQHGSWNRSVPVGYRVLRIRFDKATGQAIGTEVFAQGWLQGRGVSGRPVAMAELADGSLLVSDDGAGLVYRISYQGK